jgi:Uma2 family endonuclease
MSEPAQRQWTVEEFLAWQKDQPVRYEFVGGFPVRLMAGATNVHDDIVVNLIAELRKQLRGGGGRPFTGDGGIETLAGKIRRPDAGVDCGRRDPNAMLAAEPRMVAEVLSPSTRDFDTFEKLEEYKAVAPLAYLLVIEPNAPEVVLWSRGTDRTWQRQVVSGIDRNVAMPEIGVTLRLSDLYDGSRSPSVPAWSGATSSRNRQRSPQREKTRDRLVERQRVVEVRQVRRLGDDDELRPRHRLGHAAHHLRRSAQVLRTDDEQRRHRDGG